MKRCEAYSASSGLNPEPFNNATTFELALPPLPAGNYVINGKVLVGDRSSLADTEVVCTLRHGATGNIVIDSSSARVFGGAPWKAGSTSTLPLSATLALTAPDTLKLSCTTTSPDAFAQYAQLNAVTVEKIT